MHIINAVLFADKSLLEKIFNKADELQQLDIAHKIPKLLDGYVIATVFYETSTRTRLSFESAALKLGANVISMHDPKTSSVSKGESLEDTIKIIAGFCDLIVFRHPKAGTAQEAANVSSVPIVNGGDGGNEHPTQAAYDLYTIHKELGRLDNLKVAFGFDPKHSRTIKSLSRLLAGYANNKLIFVAPKSLDLPEEIKQELKAAGADCVYSEDFSAALDCDVLYLNRLQQERFVDPKEFETLRHKYQLTAKMLEGKKGVVLDPLPRIDEIATDVDALPNAKYFEQAKNGLYVRAALLLWALGQV